MFKDNIEPTWEAPGNEGGGTWTLFLGVDQSVDLIFSEAALALIGSQLPDEELCGLGRRALKKRRSMNVLELTATNQPCSGQQAQSRRPRSVLDVLDRTVHCGHHCPSLHHQVGCSFTGAQVPHGIQGALSLEPLWPQYFVG